MKIDRRAFMSLGVGAAAGTALSPLPWKLIDDMSIWTQNWPWTPVPPEGAISYVQSTCSLCQGGCGISIKKNNERVVKIEGRKDHPVNQGGICLLGLCGPQLLYSPTRIKSPLKRVGKRGQGQWQPITWNEAFQMIVSKLQELRKENQTQKLACILPNETNSVSQLFKRFLEVYGSSNFFCEQTADDSLEAAIQLMTGFSGPVGYDLENSDYILSFGCGLLDGWGSPVHLLKTHGNWRNSKNAVRFIQIDSRLSNTASKADNWLPIKPGTEAALALGIAHVMIHEGRIDQKFVSSYCKGIGDLQKNTITPENAAAITGLKVKQIISIAREFSSATKPIALFGRGRGDSPTSIHDAMSVFTLNILNGRINKSGGVVIKSDMPSYQWASVQQDSIAKKGLESPRVDDVSQKDLIKYSLNRMSANVANENIPLIKILMIAESNPYHTMPNSDLTQKAFSKIPFIVSFSSFMDETAQQSDVVLPNHFYLERLEEVTGARGYAKSITSLIKPAIKPLYNTRHVGDVLITIAKKMGGTIQNAFPWKSYEDCLLDAIPTQWKQLKENGFLLENSIQSLTRFKTSSGKIELSTKIGAPKYQETVLEGKESVYPLILTLSDSIRMANGYAPDAPFMLKTLDDTVLKGNEICIDINPLTAMKMGVRNKQSVWLVTPKGKAKVRIHYFEGIMPNVIALPRGLGHSAYDDYLAGKGVNTNTLIEPVEDKASGFDVAWGIRARLEG